MKPKDAEKEKEKAGILEKLLRLLEETKEEKDGSIRMYLTDKEVMMLIMILQVSDENNDN